MLGSNGYARPPGTPLRTAFRQAKLLCGSQIVATLLCATVLATAAYFELVSLGFLGLGPPGMELANTYFDTWNKHDLEGLRGLFHEDVALRDWDVEKFGANEVVEANGGIFEAVPNIQIEVLKIHESTGVVSAEILVHLNNEAKDVLKVVDIIEHSDGKITAVRAYKG
mmetsp:Transcript_43588/g.98540  ORF Transcript_43588/g.98540 Transcript_43588/m.98540 type:complete len:168 (-) Transcript_43588:136-639(-)|eukprot:CAMPEP_0172588880 /NCGR_PEP_ID=MMETSP1068-20121228/7716_1 /TAXON_ID=35684 /ORGANISM="Pseudopedinella elastica, Strain CCMP716" /LENGTH=167 /DNA_ID=CAMNT_0013384343 /DNA_START=160 /DNA_END=663 /DNA_ORIENTATION=+